MDNPKSHFLFIFLRITYLCSFHQPSTPEQPVPFDLSGFQYDTIVDSSEIVSKIEPRIKHIIDTLL